MDGYWSQRLETREDGSFENQEAQKMIEWIVAKYRWSEIQSILLSTGRFKQKTQGQTPI